MSLTMAARAHSSASLSAPVRRAQPARRKSSWLGRVGRMVGRRPGRTLLFLAFGIATCAILANALMFQKARHPAPMLSAAPAPAPRAAAERRAEPVPVQEAATTPSSGPAAVPSRPPARPADLSTAQPVREAAPRPPAPIASQPRTAQPATTSVPKAAQAPARDPIADLLNGGDLRPPADVKGAASRSAAAPRRSAEN